MVIKPFFETVVIKRHVYKTNSGIVLAKSSEEGSLEQSQGEIVAVGPTVSKDIRVGMKVVFGRYAPKKIARKDGDYWVMSELDVLAEIEEYFNE